MTQFFNRQEAEQAAASFKAQFPQLRVWNVIDLHNQETNVYERSFFSVTYGESASFYINSQQQLDDTLALCQYITQAIADNQQSKEEDEDSFIAITGEQIDTF